MNEWLRGGLQSAWTHGGLLFAAAPVLLVALLVLLPSGRKRLVRAPLILFTVVVGIAIVDWIAPEHWESESIRTVGFGCLLLMLVRSTLLILTETRVGRVLIPPLPKIVTDVVQGLLYLAAAFLTLHAAGMEPGSLLTTSALLTAVLGLALQDTLGNLFSGLALQMGRPFDVGDWVEIDRDPANGGRVVEVGWRATKILTLDDVEVIVPNGMMAKATLRNATRPTRVSRRNISFAAGYSDPPGEVVRAALEATLGLSSVLAEPPPSVVLASYDDSGIGYTLRYYTDDVPGAVVTDGEVRTRLWYVLRRRGIGFPFPQRDVHLFVPDRERESKKLSEGRIEALRRIPMFRVLDEASLAALAGDAETRLFGPRERVVTQGDAGDEMFAVEAGEVSIQSDGVEVARLRQGDFFGEMSLLTGEKRAATVVAVNTCRLLVVGHRALQHAFAQHPELMQRFSEALAARQFALENHRREASIGGIPPVQQRSRELLGRIRAYFS